MRGRCCRCRYSFRLRADGSVQTHYLYSGSQKHDEPCGQLRRAIAALGWQGNGQ